jgi:hypothetical protein
MKSRRRIYAPPQWVIFGHVGHYRDVGFEHFGRELWTQLRLRTAGAALIDQNEIAAWSIGMARLIIRVDCQRPSRPSADVDDGVWQWRLLSAFGNNDREIEVPGGGVVVVARHCHCAAS